MAVNQVEYQVLAPWWPTEVEHGTKEVIVSTMVEGKTLVVTTAVVPGAYSVVDEGLPVG